MASASAVQRYHLPLAGMWCPSRQRLEDVGQPVAVTDAAPAAISGAVCGKDAGSGRKPQTSFALLPRSWRLVGYPSGSSDVELTAGWPAMFAGWLSGVLASAASKAPAAERSASGRPARRLDSCRASSFRWKPHDWGCNGWRDGGSPVAATEARSGLIHPAAGLAHSRSSRRAAAVNANEAGQYSVAARE